VGWPHHDTDDVVSKEAGATIADIIRTKGEPAFRALERGAVQRLSALDKCVISTGGGTPINPENMSDLSKDAETVWLRIFPETVLKRAGNIATRPMIDPKDPLGSIKKRLAEREPAYAKAKHTVDTDGRTPEQVADIILSLIQVNL
jgi:shikimate kinase